MKRRNKQNRRGWRYLAVGLMILASIPTWAGGVKVIANSSVRTDSVSLAELKSIYLQEKNSLSDGSHVQPVVAKGGAVHEMFLKDYLDKSDPALQIYYRSLVFTGKGSMPKLVQSDAEMLAYVAKTKGAIGYVSASASVGGVKVLEVK
jgi:hypothetical protein